jgi:3-deoxy-manno-octulosonate cytidylyltransferase (CMP-KDO synthetase)
MKFIGIIPARYNSKRFPGKPLCDILGKPMIVHVYESSKKWENWDSIYVATDDSRIAECCLKHDIPFLMTKKEHEDCLDRCAEAVDILKKNSIEAERYIIIQGDEPLFNVKTLDIKYDSPLINFYTIIENKDEIYDKNVPKVVVSVSNKAIYFSRYGIPFHEEKTKRVENCPVFYKQIGVYVFSYDMLKKYVSLPSSNLENFEGIGLNRFLENDICVQMVYTPYDSVSVDTEEDRLKVINIKGKNEA